MFVLVMNFVEGMCFICVKYDVQGLLYIYLLCFKVGGVVFVLDVMGEGLYVIVDVIIVYVQGVGLMMDFIVGCVCDICVYVCQ